MDVDETEDIPLARASSSRRRSSVSSGGIVAATASRSAGGPLMKRAPSLPLSLPLPPRAPGGGAGSRRRASVSGGIGRVRETTMASEDQAEGHDGDASADSAADSAAGSSPDVTAAGDSSGDSTSAMASSTDLPDLVNSDNLEHDDDGGSGGDYRRESSNGSKREREGACVRARARVCVRWRGARDGEEECVGRREVNSENPGSVCQRLMF